MAAAAAGASGAAAAGAGHLITSISHAEVSTGQPVHFRTLVYLHFTVSGGGVGVLGASWSCAGKCSGCCAPGIHEEMSVCMGPSSLTSTPFAAPLSIHWKQE
jgi:hypothetical protein